MTLAELEQWMTPAGAGRSAFQTCEELQRMPSQSAKKAGIRLKIELTKAVERLLARAQSLYEAEQRAAAPAGPLTGGSGVLTVESAIHLIMSSNKPVAPPPELVDDQAALELPAKPIDGTTCSDPPRRSHGELL